MSSALNESVASHHPRPELVEMLLEANADVDARTRRGGWAALHTAAEYSNAHSVLQLIEHGVR